MKALLLFISALIASSVFSQEDLYTIKYGNTLEIKDITSKTLGELKSDENVLRCTDLQIRDPFDMKRIGEVFNSFPHIIDVFIQNHDTIESVSGIEQLKNLKEFVIIGKYHRDQAALDLSPLQDLVQLEELNVDNIPVENTNSLVKLVKLETVSLNNCRIKSIDFLKNTPHVKKLFISGDEHSFPNYEPVAGLTELSVLVISNNKQATDENLKYLVDLSKLTHFEATWCRGITNLEFLKNCKELVRLRLGVCANLSDCGAISDMPKLKFVDLGKTKIESLGFIKNWPSLESLHVYETPVSDLSPLANCSNLNELNFNYTKVADLSPLSNCRKLKFLYISYAEVSSLKPLYQLYTLNEISLKKDFNKEEVDAFAKANRTVEIIYR